MKFLVDAHLSPKLCTILTAHGHEATHVSTMPQGFRTPDTEITDKADSENRIVITKDADFSNSQLVSGRPAKLLRIRVGNTSNKTLFALIEQFVDDIVLGFGEANYVELHETMLVVHAGTRQDYPSSVAQTPMSH